MSAKRDALDFIVDSLFVVGLSAYLYGMLESMLGHPELKDLWPMPVGLGLVMLGLVVARFTRD